MRFGNAFSDFNPSFFPMNFAKFLCLLMFFCLPFNNALALNFVACPSVVFAILFAAAGLITGMPLRKMFVGSDFLLLAFYALISASFVFGTMTQTAVNHWIAYTVFIVVIYFGCGRAINGIVSVYPQFWESIMKTICVILFFTCAYGIADFALLNITGTEIPIFRAEGGGYGSAAGFSRARSFLGEPSFLANFILAWGALAFWYVFSSPQKRILKLIFTGVVSTAFCLTFSAKGIFEVLFISPILILTFVVKNGVRPGRLLGGIAVFAAGIIALCVSGFGETLWEAISVKIFGTDIANSRLERGMIVFDLMEGKNWLVGYGPASYVTLTGRTDAGGGVSFLSGVAYLLGDSGLIGLTLFFSFLGIQAFFARKLKDFGLKVAFFVTIYTSVASEFIEPTHYSPSLYLMIILLHVAIHRQKQIAPKNYPPIFVGERGFPHRRTPANLFIK